MYDENKSVLMFSGTPCNLVRVRNILNKKKNNMLAYKLKTENLHTTHKRKKSQESQESQWVNCKHDSQEINLSNEAA